MMDILPYSPGLPELRAALGAYRANATAARLGWSPSRSCWTLSAFSRAGVHDFLIAGPCDAEAESAIMLAGYEGLVG